MAELKEGTKYLSISLFGGQIKLGAFPNKKKTNAEDPAFVGNGVAVWVNTKKAGKDKEPAGDLL